MSNPRIADDMVGLIVTALKTALADNELDGFGSGFAVEVYDGNNEKTGEAIEVKLKVSATVKTVSPRA